MNEQQTQNQLKTKTEPASSKQTSGQTKEEQKSKWMQWTDERFPLSEFLDKQLLSYFAPKNFNFWYFMGSLALLVLVIQLASGIFLTMNYKPDATKAFSSVESIMRDVDFGWLIRYMHSTGASAFFLVVYLHIFRGLIYGSYRKPRELLWLIGMTIYMLLMMEAFFGYLLPWGQMSLWGAQVIVNLFASVPYIGTGLAEWVRGDFVISDVTLNRFFAFHVAAIPLVLLLFIFLHLVALRHVGSNNPDGIEIKDHKNERGIPVDGVPFHPYMTVKDIFVTMVFLLLFSFVLFYAPTGGGYLIEPPNFEEANPLKTPEHIAPVWYFTPFYAMLRAIPSIAGSQFPAVLVMFFAILVWFFLPWLDKSPVRSIRYKGPISRVAIGILVVSFIGLGILGTLPPSTLYTGIAQFLTFMYFVFFITMPVYSRIDKTKPLPTRLTK